MHNVVANEFGLSNSLASLFLPCFGTWMAVQADLSLDQLGLQAELSLDQLGLQAELSLDQLEFQAGGPVLPMPNVALELTVYLHTRFGVSCCQL